MSSQEASKMLRTYNIAWWGNNYYDVNELGHISVCPDPDVPEARVDLAELVKAREAQGRSCLARDFSWFLRTVILCSATCFTMI